MKLGVISNTPCLDKLEVGDRVTAKTNDLYVNGILEAADSLGVAIRDQRRELRLFPWATLQCLTVETTE